MKTPMQKLIEVLKVHRDTAFEKEKQYEDLVLTEYYEGRAKAFEDAISFAELHLEKEKDVMCDFADDYQRNCFQKSADDYFEETFNTKEK
jgi:hypothetical protein